MAASEAYALLDKKWRQTCSLVFGGEVGELSNYKEWLSERADPVFTSKSAISGKDVTFANGEYCKGAAWLSFDEIDFGKKFPPLSINDIKDIDSLIEAASEQFLYTGNVVLGNSKYIEKSANVSDSFHVYESSRIGDSKYIAYTSMGRLNECIFGSAAPGESEYMISCNDTYKSKRCFEMWMTANCSDCYYVFALNNCTECMFSFNLRTKSYCIGNAPLEKSKYFEIKRSLQEQMQNELVSKKRLPSLMEITNKSAHSLQEAKSGFAFSLFQATAEKHDLQPIESAFSRASKIVLGIELSGLSAYEKWLKRHVCRIKRCKSAFSNAEIVIFDYAKYFEVPAERAVTEEESLAFAAQQPQLVGVERITLQNAPDYVGQIACFALDYKDGTNRNVVDCMAYAYSNNILQCSPSVQNKNCAYCLWPRSSEHLFGCGVMFDSSFCIHCYQSVKLQRCFEVDSSRDCADCYYSHNIENCQSCMFCFNVKNLRYAIGNVEVGREKFLQAKEALLKQIGAALLKEKGLEMDIFNLADFKARKKS